MNKKQYIDPYDSIKEWLYCLINYLILIYLSFLPPKFYFYFYFILSKFILFF